MNLIFFRIALILFLMLSCFSGKAQKHHHVPAENKLTKLKISIGDKVLYAHLYDNPTAHDFISRLPFTVTLEDYADNEKVFYPKPELSIEGSPQGFNPSAGDITYFIPWGDVAIFYKNFRYSSDLISIGKIEETDVEQLNFNGKRKAKFELVEK